LSEQTDKARLRWKCRRGMRELDKAMLGYLNNYYDGASAQERADFETLLDDFHEPDLYRLVCGKDNRPLPGRKRSDRLTISQRFILRAFCSPSLLLLNARFTGSSEAYLSASQSRAQ